jgi:hypothetical protein
MYVNSKAVACLGVALAAWLVPMPGSADDDGFKVITIISLPTNSPGPNHLGLANNPLGSADISFVDPAAGVFLLADRSNKSIDVASTTSNLIIGELQPSYPGATPPTFAGAIPSANCANPVPVRGAGNCSGPNGVLSFHKRGGDEGDDEGEGKGKGHRARTEVWAGDGYSRVWVLDLKTGNPIVPPISTALPTNSTDITRADELCYDPDDGIVLVANPNSSPDFVTFISTHTYKVLGHIVMDGTGGKPNASGGIEQCQYSRRTGKFYINVPKATGVAGFSAPQDLVLEIDPVLETITNTLNLTQKSPTDGCVATPGSPPVRTAVGITGMALGSDHQIAIACSTSGPGSVVITEDFVNLYSLKGQTGADEIWYNPGDNHYFYATGAGSTPAQPILGVVDAFGDDPLSFKPQVDVLIST